MNEKIQKKIGNNQEKENANEENKKKSIRKRIDDDG